MPDTNPNPAPPTAPAPASAPTPEQLDAETKEFLGIAFASPEPPKEEKIKPPVVVPEEPAAPAAAPATPPVAPATAAAPAPAVVPPAQAPAPEPRQTINPDEFITEQTPASAPSPAAAPDPLAGMDATREERRLIRDLQLLEQVHPDRYAGRLQQALDFLKQEQAYQKAWEAAHPGEDFKEEDEEHELHYAKNQLAFDIDEVQEEAVEARVEQRVRQRVVQEDVQPALNRLEAEQRAATAQRAAVQNVMSAAQEFVQAVDPAIAALMTIDGEVVINKETSDKLQAENPEAFAVMAEVAQEINIEITELTSLAQNATKLDPNKVVKLPNGRRLYPHRVIQEAFQDTEQEWADKPASQSTRDGKRFQTGAERNAAELAIKNKTTGEARLKALSRLEAATWTITEKEVQQHLVSQKVQSTQEKLKFIDGAVDRRIKTKKLVPQPEPVQAAPSTPAAAPVNGTRVNPPNSASPADQSASLNGSRKPGPTDDEMATKIAMGLI